VYNFPVPLKYAGKVECKNLFRRIRRMRKKQLHIIRKYATKYIAHGEYTNPENMRILGLFLLLDTISRYAKTILSYMESIRKENKRIWRMHQEYFALYGDNSDRQNKMSAYLSEFSTKTKKIFGGLRSLSRQDLMSKKPSQVSSCCPFNDVHCLPNPELEFLKNQWGLGTKQE
jgi:hypothetical protein